MVLIFSWNNVDFSEFCTATKHITRGAVSTFLWRGETLLLYVSKIFGSGMSEHYRKFIFPCFRHKFVSQLVWSGLKQTFTAFHMCKGLRVCRTCIFLMLAVVHAFHKHLHRFVSAITKMWLMCTFKPENAKKKKMITLKRHASYFYCRRPTGTNTLKCYQKVYYFTVGLICIPWIQ